MAREWERVDEDTAVGPRFGALFETQRDVKTETALMSNVARRKLNCQQLENALGTSLPAVVNGYALRDAKFAESSHDEVVTTTSCERWCGWIAMRCYLE